jgi:predicted ferric reductase
VVLIVAHPLIIVIDNPSRLKLLNPIGGNWASRAGLASVLSLLLIVVTSVFRERIKLRYELWRLWHIVLGVSAIVFAQLHISMAGLYTNNTWKHAIWIVIAVLMVGLVAYLRLMKPAWQRGRHAWRVAEVRADRGETHVVALEPVGHAGLAFSPGQFAWLKLGGAFHLEEHPFSFCSSAEKRDRVEFGIKSLGDFTNHVGDIAVGTPAYLDGPHGAFSIDRYPATGYVFIAGGVGVTPFISFLRTMADRSDPRPVLMIYAEKIWDGIAFRDELESLKARVDLTVHFVLKEPHDGWEGFTGYVDHDLLTELVPRDRYARAYFICGPQRMMDGVHDALKKLDIEEQHVHLEQFNLA